MGDVGSKVYIVCGTCLQLLIHMTMWPFLSNIYLYSNVLQQKTHCQAEKNSDLSPAESRHLNQPCVLFDFYDFHDVWHFLGGFGVFFTYMFLLNIDEDVKYKRRDQLRVF